METTDFTVTKAEGAMLPNGSIAWGGLLTTADGKAVCSFDNTGNGGCCTVQVLNEAHAEWAAFGELARKRWPSNYEPAEALLGELWDAAFIAKCDSRIATPESRAVA